MPYTCNQCGDPVKDGDIVFVHLNCGGHCEHVRPKMPTYLYKCNECGGLVESSTPDIKDLPCCIVPQMKCTGKINLYVLPEIKQLRKRITSLGELFEEITEIAKKMDEILDK